MQETIKAGDIYIDTTYNVSVVYRIHHVTHDGIISISDDNYSGISVIHNRNVILYDQWFSGGDDTYSIVQFRSILSKIKDGNLIKVNQEYSLVNIKQFLGYRRGRYLNKWKILGRNNNAKISR